MAPKGNKHCKACVHALHMCMWPPAQQPGRLPGMHACQCMQLCMGMRAGLHSTLHCAACAVLHCMALTGW